MVISAQATDVLARSQRLSAPSARGLLFRFGVKSGRDKAPVKPVESGMTFPPYVRCNESRRRVPCGRHATRPTSRGSRPSTDPPRYTSPLRKTAPSARPRAFGRVTGAGRPPGSRTLALAPPYPGVTRWRGGEGLAAYSCGGSSGIGGPQTTAYRTGFPLGRPNRGQLTCTVDQSTEARGGCQCWEASERRTSRKIMSCPCRACNILCRAAPIIAYPTILSTRDSRRLCPSATNWNQPPSLRNGWPSGFLGRWRRLSSHPSQVCCRRRCATTRCESGH